MEAFRANPRSTIVYAPTVNLVHEVASHLRAELGHNVVQMYHGSMGSYERHNAHVAFLTDQSLVMVATVAFGMGIDKPDIRRIVHYGPPKTMEEYYQQIGRAGRDGEEAEVIMISTDSDFQNYQSSFYTDGLKGEPHQAYLKSLEALRLYASDTSDCRRLKLIKYFSSGQERAKFGNRCGMYDNCEQRKEARNDFQRDYTNEALLVIKSLSTQKLSKSKLIDSIKQEQKLLSLENQELKSRTREFWEELLPLMESAGHIEGKMNSFQVGRGTKQYKVYFVPQRRTAIQAVFPVPESIRKAERDIAAKKAKMESHGISCASFSNEDFTASDGVAAQKMQWVQLIERLRKSNAKMAQNHIDLLNAIFAWRKQTATHMGIAPGSILSDTMARRIAYSVPGTIEVVHAVCGRGEYFKGLLDVLLDRRELFGFTASPNSVDTLPFRDGLFKANPPPMTYTKPKAATWMASYERWQKNGERLQSIAIKQVTSKGLPGKAILAATVEQHMLTAALHGYEVDFARLAQESDHVPSVEDWKKIDIRLGGSNLSTTESYTTAVEIVGPDNPILRRTWALKIAWYCCLLRIKYFPDTTPLNLKVKEKRSASTPSLDPPDHCKMESNQTPARSSVQVTKKRKLKHKDTMVANTGSQLHVNEQKDISSLLEGLDDADFEDN